MDTDPQTVRDALVALGQDLGDARGMAIFGEGNVSGKLSADRFLVKASGARMAALGPEHLVELDARPLREAVGGGEALTDAAVEALLMAARVDAAALKPSVESLFHAWLLGLPGVHYVGHVHATRVNALLCSTSADAFAIRRLFPDQVVYCGPQSVLVPYVDPGLPLAASIASLVEAFIRRIETVPKTILLRNHGIIGLGATPADVMAALAMAEKAAQIFIQARILGGPIYLDDVDVHRIASRSDEHYRQRMLTHHLSL